MKTLAELDLPFLAVEEEKFAADPTRFFAEARTHHSWLAKSNIGYYVHEYDAVRDLLVRNDKLRTSFDGIVELMNAKGTPWGRFTEHQMIAQQGDAHKRLRDLFAPKFSPRQADSHRHLMRSVISDLLDEWLPRGEFDFEEFASYFPISVLMTMVGASREKIPELRWAMETLGLGFSMDQAMLPKLQEAIAFLDQFAADLMAERRANPLPPEQSDLLDLMMTASEEGSLTDRELRDLLVFLFVAGYDTSKNVLTYMMFLMIEHPEIYQRCASDMAYCQQTVEESLRYFSPATIFRMATEDFIYRDVLIPKDTLLFFPLSIVGRDPGAFPEPDRFDPEREVVQNRRHVAFGRGPHVCLGQFIARAQLEEGLHLIARRLKNPRRVGAIGWRPFPGVWGMKGMPIAFDVA